MKRIETKVNIDARPEEVWDVLMDFPSYPSWNPMVVELAGDARLGERLEVTIAMKGGRRMRFTPTVVEYEQGRRFGWLGRVLVRGLFDGLHRFEIEANGATTTFVHSEEFRGLLPPLLGGVLRDTHEGVVAMNEALAREVARRSG
jgi:hypothetical protein